MADAPTTVVETVRFLKDVRAMMSDGRGKRGGARVIYYYHDERLPVFLLAAYAKNEKANLSMAERNAMKRLIPVLVARYPAKSRRTR